LEIYFKTSVTTDCGAILLLDNVATFDILLKSKAANHHK
jgi:hypothetical protein